MVWKVEVRPGFERSFKRLDEQAKSRIIRAIEELSHSKNPVTLGEMLAGKWKGCLKLRIGDYRIIYQVFHPTRTIIFLETGHRREVY